MYYNTSNNQNTHDPWKTTRQNFYSLFPDENTNSEKFSPSEVKLLTQSLNDLKSYIQREFKLLKISNFSPNLKFEKQIQCLKNELQTKSKNEWKFSAMSFPGGVIMTLSVDLQTGIMLYQMLFKAVNELKVKAEILIKSF